jgi:ubiquinone/menaquinone biosynthesis C-methylase UbiE
MEDNSKHLELNEAKWDKWADTLDKKNWRNDYLRNAQSQVIALLNVQPGVHFLDIGCGTGWAVGQVAKLVHDQGLFYGVDLSPKMIEKARGNFIGRAHLVFTHANVESIPLDSDFFDVIICTNSFHHYPNPAKALDEMFRLLKSGGKVLILDPTADTWLIKLVDKIIKIVEPEHVKMYSTKEFQQLFGEAGLKYSNSKIMNGHESIHIGEK